MRRGSSSSTWVWLAAGLAAGFGGLAAIMLLTGGDDPGKPTKSGGTRAKAGDVTIESPGARAGTYQGKSLGEWKLYGPHLIVKFKVTNTSKTKIVRLKGWQGKAAAEDEHGNQYRAIDFGLGFAGFGDDPLFDRSPKDAEFNKGCDTSAMLAYNLSLHPGKSYITYLIFEKPADVSKELRLTLPGSEMGVDAIRMRVPIRK